LQSQAEVIGIANCEYWIADCGFKQKQETREQYVELVSGELATQAERIRRLASKAERAPAQDPKPLNSDTTTPI